MEKHNNTRERLIAPTDFISPPTTYNLHWELVPPSHFASDVQSTGVHKLVQPPPTSWLNPVQATVPRPPCPANPWLTNTQSQRAHLDLKARNERITMRQVDGLRGNTTVDQLFTERAGLGPRLESEYQHEVDKHKAEADRLKGQLEALREAAESHREEMKSKDITLCRYSHELEVVSEKLSKAMAELSRCKEELGRSVAQKGMIRAQLEKVKAESEKEIENMKRELVKSREESRELALKAEMRRLQIEEEAKEQTLRLLKQLEKMKDNQEVQIQELNASHCEELEAQKNTNAELQNKLQSASTEVVQLNKALVDISAEKDGLREHLSHMGKAFETQSATLQSLRNYIGQLTPERGDEEQLNEVVERLNKEKTALQKTTELLTVRYNSINEILTLQEEKLVKKLSTDPLMRHPPEILQVLRMWREKVFKLCIQLRFKDLEMRREKEELLSETRYVEQQLQQEQHRANVLRHSLDDRIAELKLGRVEQEATKEDLAKVRQENSELKSRSQKAEADVKSLTEAVQRFKREMESKVAEVESAKTRLHTFTKRLSFATRRVETIQALVLRRVALEKVKQACKQPEQEEDSLTTLQIEHNLVREERDRLAQELRKTPELIEKALIGLKEQYESKVRQLQEELEQSCTDLKLALAGQERAEQNLQQVQEQLDESSISSERLRCELLSQQERSAQVLQERVSEIEAANLVKLKELELQLHAARREHTKAVMTLREFQRQAATKQDEMRDVPQWEGEPMSRGMFNLKEKDQSAELLSGTVPVKEGAAAAAAHTHVNLWNQDTTSESRCSVEAEAQHIPTERLLGVLEELHVLSAAVVNSSEDSADEEIQSGNGTFPECSGPSSNLHYES